MKLRQFRTPKVNWSSRVRILFVEDDPRSENSSSKRYARQAMTSSTPATAKKRLRGATGRRPTFWSPM